MKNYSIFLVSIIIFSYSVPLHAQLPKDITSEIEIQATGTTNGIVPFWMRSNQYGSIPLSGASASVIGKFTREYQERDKSKLIDWGFGFNGRANGGKGPNLQLIESYVKGRLSIFQLKAGRSKDVMGLNGDTSLSSGNFAMSGNALGIPKIELSIPEYYRIPVLDGLFSFKGNIAHGWLGKTQILNEIRGVDAIILYKIKNTQPVSYIHQKSLYVRLGTESWKLNLYGGFNHQVFWGQEGSTYNGNFKLSPLETFFYVATGRTYGAKGVPSSKIGNQLGSIDLALEYNFEAVKLMIYRQNFYDVGALSKLANIADGLNGLSFTNRKIFDSQNRRIGWRKLLIEFFYSKDQAGYPWSKPTKSGDEDYYNNFFYINGWSYYGLGIGNPLITAKQDLKNGQATSYGDFFVNNRISAINIGFEGDVFNWMLKTKVTYSSNYGTYATSVYGNSTGSIRNPQTTNVFTKVNQVSLFIEALKPIKQTINVGFSAGLDHGDLLINSFGLSLKAIKTFN
jgi:hypothetical protein